MFKYMSEREKIFCDEYLKNPNATLAARAAGYAQPEKMACTLKKRPAVKNYLKEHGERRRKQLEVTADRVLKELARIAFHDIGDYFKKNQYGRDVLKPLAELTVDQRAAISEYDPVSGAIKLYSKDPSLDKLGKYLKLFTELHETQHTFTMMGDVVKDGVKLEFNVGTPKKKK